MRVPLYDHAARRKTVSITLNADLVARAARHGINISRIAEAALMAAFEAAEKAKIREDIQQAAQFTDEIIRRYGHPFSQSRALFLPEHDTDDAA